MDNVSYYWRLTCTDYGTERLLEVLDRRTEAIVGACDPFWPGGIPLNPARRDRICSSAANTIVTKLNNI